MEEVLAVRLKDENVRSHLKALDGRLLVCDQILNEIKTLVDVLQFTISIFPSRTSSPWIPHTCSTSATPSTHKLLSAIRSSSIAGSEC